jgi:hypothetical protein
VTRRAERRQPSNGRCRALPLRTPTFSVDLTQPSTGAGHVAGEADLFMIRTLTTAVVEDANHMGNRQPGVSGSKEGSSSLLTMQEAQSEYVPIEVLAGLSRTYI